MKLDARLMFSLNEFVITAMYLLVFDFCLIIRISLCTRSTRTFTVYSNSQILNNIPLAGLTKMSLHRSTFSTIERVFLSALCSLHFVITVYYVLMCTPV